MAHEVEVDKIKEKNQSLTQWVDIKSIVAFILLEFAFSRVLFTIIYYIHNTKLKIEISRENGGVRIKTRMLLQNRIQLNESHLRQASL